MAETGISGHRAGDTANLPAGKGDASIDKIPQKGEDSEVKDTSPAEVIGLDDEAAIPKGTIDPVYEAKARVLNHAVSTLTICIDITLKYLSRSKRSAWDGINGNSLSSSASAGQTTTFGP